LVKEEKKFCPACGNDTLWRTPVIIGKDGEMIVLHNSNKVPSLRGTIYNIPKPKNGKNPTSAKLVTSEDTYEMALKKMKRNGTQKKSVDTSLDADHVFGPTSAPPKTVQIGYGKKNPNVARKKVGKKNRSQMQQ